MFEQKAVVMTVGGNNRMIEDSLTGLSFQKGRETLVKPRELKAKTIKDMLIKQDIIVISGEVRFEVRGKEFVFAEKKEKVETAEAVGNVGVELKE